MIKLNEKEMLEINGGYLPTFISMRIFIRIFRKLISLF